MKLNFKKLFVFLFLSCGQIGVFGQGINTITEQISKLGGDLPNKEIVKMIDYLYQQKVINEEGRKQLNAFAESRVYPQLMKKKEGESGISQTEKLKMITPLIFGKDSTKLNRSAILTFLGLIDIGNIEDKISSKNALKNAEINPFLGELWNFKPVLTGDEKNPFSYKFDMTQYRENYSKLIDAIYKSGLMDEKVYADTKIWLDKKEFYIMKDFSILLYAAMRNVYYDSFKTLKEVQTSAIDSLTSTGIINKIDVSLLDEKFSKYQLFSKTEIFKNKQNKIVFNANQIDVSQKETIIRNLFDEIKNLIPDLKISNLKLETVESETKASSNPILGAVMSSFMKFIDSKKLVVSANFNGKNYIKEIKLTSFNKELVPEDDLKLNLEKLINSNWLNNNDVQIFNDFLIDSGSKNRIFVVGDEFNVFPKRNSSEKVVFLMDSSQTAIVLKKMPMMGLIFGKKQDFEGVNSLTNLKSIYQNLLSTKIIEPIEEKKFENIILSSRKSNESSELKNEIIYSLLSEKPNVLVKGDIFKKEGLVPSFEKFIANLASSSKGAFKPEAIQSNFEDELANKVDTDTYNFIYSFTVDGVQYADTIDVEPITDEEKSMNEILGTNRLKKIETAVMLSVKKASNTRFPYSLKNTNETYLFLTEEEYLEINEKMEYILEEIIDEESYQESQNDEPAIEFNATEYIAELSSNDMIDEAGIARLNEKFGDEKPNYKFGYIPFLKNNLNFEISSNLKEENSTYFKNLYESIQNKFLPEIKIENFNVKSETISSGTGEDGYIENFEKVSYSIDGQNYFDIFRNFSEGKESILAQIEAGTPKDSIYFGDIFIPNSVFNNYLTDIVSNKRLFYTTDLDKFIVNYLTQEQLTIIESDNFGNATRKNVIQEIEKLIEIQLIDKIAPEKLEDVVNQYRAEAINVETYSLLNSSISKSDKFMFFEIIDANNNLIWPATTAKITKNEVVLNDFKDNYKEISAKIELENQKENPEERAEKLTYQSSFIFNKRKISFDLDLNVHDNYYMSVESINELVISKINEELEKLKKSNKLYIDYNSRIFYINKSQLEYLNNNGIQFLD